MFYQSLMFITLLFAAHAAHHHNQLHLQPPFPEPPPPIFSF